MYSTRPFDGAEVGMLDGLWRRYSPGLGQSRAGAIKRACSHETEGASDAEVDDELGVLILNEVDDRTDREEYHHTESEHHGSNARVAYRAGKPKVDEIEAREKERETIPEQEERIGHAVNNDQGWHRGPKRVNERVEMAKPPHNSDDAEYNLAHTRGVHPTTVDERDRNANDNRVPDEEKDVGEGMGVARDKRQGVEHRDSHVCPAVKEKEEAHDKEVRAKRLHERSDIFGRT